MKARVLKAAVDANPPWLEKARTVAKRLSGISKEHAPRFHVAEDFTKADDAAIHDVVQPSPRGPPRPRRRPRPP